jgi:hypothetical protein
MVDATKLQSLVFEIRPSDTRVGVEVLDLDLSKPLDEAAYEKVSAALDRFSVVCFRDQVLTPEQHIAFSRRSLLFDDFGVTINPLLLAGQVHGGAVQGIGQANLENTVYDRDSGQLVTATLMDYALPRADDAPSFALESRNVRCATNPLGVKGAGEAGAIGSAPCRAPPLIGKGPGGWSGATITLLATTSFGMPCPARGEPACAISGNACAGPAAAWLDYPQPRESEVRCHRTARASRLLRPTRRGDAHADAIGNVHERQYFFVVVFSQMRLVGPDLIGSHTAVGLTLHRWRPYQRVVARPFPSPTFLD